MAVFAIVRGFVAAVIAGGSPPNLTITEKRSCSPAQFGSSASGAIRERLAVLPPDLAL
jgi:hypothetical protein